MLWWQIFSAKTLFNRFVLRYSELDSKNPWSFEGVYGSYSLGTAWRVQFSKGFSHLIHLGNTGLTTPWISRNCRQLVIDSDCIGMDQLDWNFNLETIWPLPCVWNKRRCLFLYELTGITYQRICNDQWLSMIEQFKWVQGNVFILSYAFPNLPILAVSMFSRSQNRLSAYI